MVAFFLLVLIAALVKYWYVVLGFFGLWLLCGLVAHWWRLERQRTEEIARHQRARREIDAVAWMATQAMIEATRERGS